MGVGPYRLVHWEPGAFAQLQSFDAFYGDTPRVKSVTFRFVRDTNTALANILAGEIDVMLGRSLGLEPTVEGQTYDIQGLVASILSHPS